MSRAITYTLSVTASGSQSAARLAICTGPMELGEALRTARRVYRTRGALIELTSSHHGLASREVFDGKSWRQVSTQARGVS